MAERPAVPTGRAPCPAVGRAAIGAEMAGATAARSGRHRVHRDLFVQVGVRPGAAELQLAFLFPVDQDPVGLDLAVSPCLHVTAEGVIPVPRFQLLASTSGLDHRAEFLQVLAALLQTLQIPLELRSGPGR